MDPTEKVRRAEGRRNSQIGRRQSLTSSHVEQMKETLKERAAKYKELIYHWPTRKPWQNGRFWLDRWRSTPSKSKSLNSESSFFDLKKHVLDLKVA